MVEPLNDEVWAPGELLERLQHRDRFGVGAKNASVHDEGEELQFA
ncbi:MAG TPA: hypothetical protein VNY05_39820 [Candidatus Acidoferrales bacterium]|nr:hypothetical protein [Candidatus Acidoferrales bacterium]